MAAMEPYQRRILRRIADEIESCRAGRQTLILALNNSWGLFTAAELRDPSETETFLDLFYALSTEDVLRQSWIPVGLASDDRFASALLAFEAWAAALRDEGTSTGLEREAER